MAWTPTYNATDTRAIVPNLKAYFEEKQEEAFAWANDDQPLPKFVEIFVSQRGRQHLNFPDLTFEGEATSTDYADDGLRIKFVATMVMRVVSGGLDELQAEVKVRQYGLESMLANIPNTTLMANVNGASRATLQEIEATPEFLGRGAQSGYLQVTRLTVTWTLRESPYYGS